MSHFSTVKTQLRKKEFLKQALIDLGYVPNEGFENLLIDRDVFAAQTVYFGFDLTEPGLEDSDKMTAASQTYSLIR